MTRTPQQLADTIDRAQALLKEELPGDSVLLPRLFRLRERLRREQLQLAVIGQFKRGKSTFLNALLGAPLLPVGVVPVTALPVFISWGARAKAVASFRGGWPPETCDAQDCRTIRNFLSHYASEQGNPENRHGVARIDLCYPAPLLDTGTVLIDTPGVGSTLRHNTEAAMNVLPECDAALFILSADPPITDVETTYLQSLKGRQPHIFFILNKADRLTAEDAKTASDFLADALKMAGMHAPEIFALSAKDGLAAKEAGDAVGHARSGLAAVESRLVRFLAREKQEVLAKAIETAARAILTQSAAEAELRERLLRMPLEDLAARANRLTATLETIERRRLTTRDLLYGERQRLIDALKNDRERLYRETVSELAALIERGVKGGTWTGENQSALERAIEDAFEAARDGLVASFGQSTNAALAGHQEKIAGLIDQVGAAVSGIFEVSFVSAAEPTPFSLSIDPYWVTENPAAARAPGAAPWRDLLLPSSLRQRRLRARLLSNAEDVTLRNMGNLNWAIMQSLADIFRRATAEFEKQLDDALRTTRGVVEDALARRHDQAGKTKTELERLERFRGLLRSLRDELAPPPNLIDMGAANR
jgi:GTP-binding protein EngB required for normal cell division